MLSQIQDISAPDETRTKTGKVQMFGNPRVKPATRQDAWEEKLWLHLNI